MDVLEAIDKFLNASTHYRAEEPTRRELLIELAKRELGLCDSDERREQLEKRMALLEQP